MEDVARGSMETPCPPDRVTSSRATLSHAITEVAFQNLVIELLQAHRWRYMHPYDSRRSTAGYPDITAVHPQHGLLFAELKSAKGRATIEQQAWLEDLAHFSRTIGDPMDAYEWNRSDAWMRASQIPRPRVVVGLFRPSAWDWLEAIAAGRRP